MNTTTANPIPLSRKSLRIGILGGGQLARMLAIKAFELGHEAHILSEKTNDPAAQVTRFHHIGNPADSDAVKLFCQHIDVLTFESEFFKAEDLKKNIGSTPIYPSIENMQILQDRLTQKNALLELKIPTAKFWHFYAQTQLSIQQKDFSEIEALLKKKKQLVIKKRMGGYDGYGTYIIQSTENLKEFIQSLSSNVFLSDFIIEEMIPFRRELALMIARDQLGKIVFYPLMQSQQVKSKCDWVIGPVKHPQLSALQKKLKKLMIRLNYVGVMGVELFDTGKELLINEVAPRVHNSGHYTMNATCLDQFAVHIQAISGGPIYSPLLMEKYFCMINLIGVKDGISHPPASARGFLHWYGKKDSLVGRKMGHINYQGKTSKILLKNALKDRKKWIQEC